jgi:hypothetical protein
MLGARRRGILAALVGLATLVAVLLAGCGFSATSGEPVTPRNDSGYRVLTGAVPLPLAGTGESATPLAAFGSATPALSPEVPSASGHWYMTSVATGFFRRTQKVELLATGRHGERFNLYWQESCGGTREGKHGVLGGSGGEADLTLHVPALILVKLPSRYGTYSMCYLAATVSMHMPNWKLAKAAAPTVKVIHY